MQGTTELVLSLYGGKEPYCTRSLLLRRNNQYAGLRVPARGRGGVQVLERLGPESAQNLYSTAPPGPCRGLQNLCCLCMAGRNPTVHVRYFLGQEKQSVYAGLRVPARGRGGVQVLERLGLESAENLYSPAPPGQRTGLQNLCCFCMAGRNPTRSLLLRRSNQEAGLRVPARGRGGVQVLERLGLESAENLYSPAPPGQCRGLQNLCCLCMAGRNPTVHVRYFLGEAISTRACGCRPGDAGEYRFWNAWGLKVPKTCTPPRPPGNAGDYRTCAVVVWRAGTLLYTFVLPRRNNQYQACGCRPGDAGEYRFWTAWGLKVPKTCTPPRPPGPCRVLQNLCCLCMAGRNPTVHVRYFLGQEKQSVRGLAGAGPGTRGSTGFGTLGA